MADHSSEFSRRKFMAASLGAIASAGLAGMAPGMAVAQTETTSSAEGDILSRTLGKTGFKVPIVSMGGGACNDPALVQACYEEGMRMFDTAASYAYGRNEQMIASGLRKLKVRDRVKIITKFHTPAQRDPLADDQHRAVMTKTLDGSLRRLKTDHVDILMLHDVRSPETLGNQAILETMVELKKSGKARAIGVATHRDMAAVINAAIDTKVFDVVLTSLNFTMADDTALLAAIERAAGAGMGVIGMKSLAGGGRFPNPETLRAYSSRVINGAALKWVLRNKNIATTIPGIGNFDHMRDNFAIARDLELTEDEQHFLADNQIQLGMEFCRQCAQCLASCPENVDVPNLMRTHMYAAQYGDFALARRTLDEIPKFQGLTNCTNCSACVAECANTVNIPRKIDELKLIYA